MLDWLFILYITDALLADLQSTAGMSAIFDAPPPEVNGHTDGKESPSAAGKPFSYSPIPPRSKSDTAKSSVSELDSLLDDLGEKSKFNLALSCDTVMQITRILENCREVLLVDKNPWGIKTERIQGWSFIQAVEKWINFISM